LVFAAIFLFAAVFFVAVLFVAFISSFLKKDQGNKNVFQTVKR
jgi:archaellum component FlaF (FlaF/FlaG flagellin family)